MAIQKINWLQLASVIVSVLVIMGSALIWVNSNIVALNTKMDAIQKADFKADMNEYKEDLRKEIEVMKADQREKDKAQWERINQKKDKY